MWQEREVKQGFPKKLSSNFTLFNMLQQISKFQTDTVIKKKVFFLHDKFLDTKRLSETDSNFSLQSTKLTYFSRCFWLYDRFEKCLLCWYHLTSICWALLIHIYIVLLKTAQRTSSRKCENFPRQDFVGQRGISPKDIQKSWHQ